MDPMQFLDILDSHLSEAELSALCRQFGVDYNAFPGSTQREKAREFLGYIRRGGRMAGLAEATTVLRPDLSSTVAQFFESKEDELSWIDGLTGADDRVMDSGLTWRWSSSTSSAQARPGQLDEKDVPSPADVSNPYTPGRMIVDETMFFGRDIEWAQLRRHISAGEHVAIVSGRNFGGSSLLYRAARSFDDSPRLLSAYVDLRDPSHQTLSGLFDSAWSQWWGRVRPGNTARVRTLHDFVTAVHKLSAAGYQPLLFLDELEQLAWRPSVFSDEVFEAWRALGDNGQLGFVLTSHTSPADLLAQNGLSSRFYELFQLLNVGLLGAAAARDMLVIPLQRANIEASGGAVDYFLDRAGPHPFFLQLAGHYLFDSLARRAYSRDEVDRVFTAAAEPFWQELWDSMTPLAQEYYPVNLSSAVEGMSGRQLRIIANKGLAIAEDEGIGPFSAGFADWLVRIRTAAEAAATVSPD